MARPLRLTYPRALHHVTMRCNNKEFLFEEESFRLFLDLLKETCHKFGVPLYSYCLMTNHVHLLFKVKKDDVLSPFMHRLANTFAKRFNAIRRRKGHLWEGRFRSTIVHANSYFLRCMAYIDLNPVRAGIVKEPGDYPWSSYRYLAEEDESFITLHKAYLELGKGPKTRFRKYSRLLEEELAREPYSLADVLVVGSRHFTSQAQERFGIVDEQGLHAKAVELDGSLRAIELRPGRVPLAYRSPS